MAVEVVIKDETTSGDVLGELALQLQAEQTSVREIIETRVRAEVRAYNASKVLGTFKGLVQPTDAERQLNGRRQRPRRVDADAQVAAALTAFERGHVLVLVDDLQRDELESELTLHAGSTVTFLKLAPLVGG